MNAAAVPGREVVTPEGVPLRFELAGVGARAAALLLDLGLLIASALALVFALMLFGVLVGKLSLALVFVALFSLRCFYFTAFEVRWHGATPGKRAVGLRVIDAHGGPLSGEAVFARNLMREVELFLPLTVLLAPEHVLPDVAPVARPVALAWLALLALLPLFNRDGLRAGDLAAGTLVVRAPHVALLADLGEPVEPRGHPTPPAAALPFTARQLDVYGIHELHVLENLLRQAQDAADPRFALVAERVQRKIGWEDGHGAGGPSGFLRAFYAAQRARLEQRLTLGERRERKSDVSRTP